MSTRTTSGSGMVFISKPLTVSFVKPTGSQTDEYTNSQNVLLARSSVLFTIFGEPASKANSRRNMVIGGMSRSIKSKKALGYEADAVQQIPPCCRVRYDVPVSVTMRIFYASERPDLDESLILDILQDRYVSRSFGGVKSRELVQRGVYANDRLVREKHIYHAIDKKNPRTIIEVRPIEKELF